MHNNLYKSKWLAAYLSCWMALTPIFAAAEDIDIFTGASAGSSANPNILIVIDNTSNWSRQSQQWPGGVAQGQSEANAIKTVINALGSTGANVNIGLMEFVTTGTANDQGGFIRYAIQPMTATNVSNFSSKLDTIYNNISSPDEKRNANTPYGDLMYDVYNYYAGTGVSNDGSNASAGLNPPNLDTDANGYTTNYSTFKSPLSAAKSCARNFLIFIGNPNSSGPAADSDANSCALYNLSNGTTSCPSGKFQPQLGLPNFGVTQTTFSNVIGQTGHCYTGAQVSNFNSTISSCLAGNIANCYATNVDTNYVTYNSPTNSSVTGCSVYTQDCSIGTASSTTYPMACPSGTQSYNVVQTANVTTTTTGAASTNSAQSTVCYPTLAAATTAVTATSNPDTAGMTCPIPALPSGASSISTMQSTFTSTRTYTTTSGSVTSTSTATNNCSYSLGLPYPTASCSGATTSTSTTYPTTSCYATAPASPTLGNPATTPAFSACPAGSTCTYTAGSATTACPGTPAPTSSTTTSCYAAAPTFSNPGTSSSVATVNTLTCPSGYTCNYAASNPNTTGCTAQTTTDTTTAAYASAPTVTSPATSSSIATVNGLTCPSGMSCTYSVGAPSATMGATQSAYTYSCSVSPPSTTTGATTSPVAVQSGTNGVTATLNCPAGALCTYTASSLGTSAVKDGLGKNCGASGSTGSGSIYLLTQTVSALFYPITQTTQSLGAKYTITQTPNNLYQWNITQTATPTGPSTYSVTQTVTSTVSTTAATATTLGQSSQCYSSAPTYTWSPTSDYSSSCTGTNVSCAYGAAAGNTTNYCPAGTSQYSLLGNNTYLTQGPTGSQTTDTATYNADEWARLMFQQGVPVAGSTNATINTYTIDVYNAQPNSTESALYMSMARNGGGKYYVATNAAAIAAALSRILAEIQSVNSTFASASLPVNSTNRAQNANQVFIGMFRPDPNANPRWFGNLKQYQIGGAGTSLDLYDDDTPPKPAVNPLTGFLDNCALSFWTTDSPTPSTPLAWSFPYYWSNIGNLSPAPVGKCPGTHRYSDLPDGPLVEKGAVAEVLRKGNDPATTNANPTWTVNRNLYTLSSGALTAYTSSTAGTLPPGTFNFTQGKDVNNDTGLGGATTSITRPSIHGDVVHSRPLPINYGTSANANAGVTAFYGSNDGTYRAVVASGSEAGKELWAFIAPEFSSIAASRNPLAITDPLTRLMNNNPPINYPVTPAVTGGIPKDYFFDGSTGVFQNIDNSKVWIYPSMRRGGRMIYAFDVTNSAPGATGTPLAFKWRVGCPDLTDDTGCTSGMSGIGQTWSTPTPVFVEGYSMTSPVVVVGGGYDNCEDANTGSPSCSGAKGHAIYVLDADTGTVLRTFTDSRMGSVVADVTFVDPDNDSDVEYAYVVDTRGNIYRINFEDPTTGAALTSANWTIQRIAYTSGAGRKFLFEPGLLVNNGKVYVAITSGDREHPLVSNYPYTTPVTNRIYVYLDDLVTTETDLDGSSMSNFTNPTACNTPGIVQGSSNHNKGWYMDLGQAAPGTTTPATGEQGVTATVIGGGMLTTSTNYPIPAGSGVCSTSLGMARGYWLNLFNASGAMGVTGSCGGNRFGTFAGGGLPPSPVIGTVPVGGVPTTVIIGAIQREGGTSSPIAPQVLKPTIQSTRKLHYWKNSGDN